MEKQTSVIRTIAMALVFSLSLETLGQAAALAPVWPAIPSSHGSVQSLSSTAPKESSRKIIHIQDAHNSLDAQKKISSILTGLVRNYELNLVGVEGNAGVVDPSLVSSFPDAAVRQSAAESLLSETKISAAEFCKIISQSPVEIYGSEDAALYRENVRTYQDLLSAHAPVAKETAKISKILRRLAPMILSPRLLELGRLKEKYENNLLSFDEYWAALNKEIVATKTPLDGFSQLSALVALSKNEKEIDFNLAETQRTRLLTVLEKRLNPAQFETVIKEALRFKLEEITPGAFCALLFETAQRYGISAVGFEELAKYAEYARQFEVLNLSQVLEEIERLNSDLEQALFENEAQRDFSKHTKALRILARLLEGKLSSADHAYYQQNPALFEMAGLENYLRKTAAQYGIETGAVHFDVLKSEIPVAERFYSQVNARNQKMLDNLLRRMEEKKQNVAALVTGGFHTEGLSQLMGQSQLSYLVVIPKFDPAKGKRPYAAVITRKGSYLDQQTRFEAQKEAAVLVLGLAVLQGMKFEEAKKAVLASISQDSEQRQETPMTIRPIGSMEISENSDLAKNLASGSIFLGTQDRAALKDFVLGTDLIIRRGRKQAVLITPDGGKEVLVGEKDKPARVSDTQINPALIDAKKPLNTAQAGSRLGKHLLWPIVLVAGGCSLGDTSNLEPPTAKEIREVTGDNALVNPSVAIVKMMTMDDEAFKKAQASAKTKRVVITQAQRDRYLAVAESEDYYSSQDPAKLRQWFESVALLAMARDTRVIPILRSQAKYWENKLDFNLFGGVSANIGITHHFTSGKENNTRHTVSDDGSVSDSREIRKNVTPDSAVAAAQFSAEWALGLMRYSFQEFMRLFNQENPTMRTLAVWGLAQFADEDLSWTLPLGVSGLNKANIVDDLIRYDLEDPDSGVRAMAAWALGEYAGEALKAGNRFQGLDDLVKKLRKNFNEGSTRVRFYSALALVAYGEKGDARVLGEIARQLREENDIFVLSMYAKAAGRFKSRDAVAPLLERLVITADSRDPKRRAQIETFRSAVINAIATIGASYKETVRAQLEAAINRSAPETVKPGEDFQTARYLYLAALAHVVGRAEAKKSLASFAAAPTVDVVFPSRLKRDLQSVAEQAVLAPQKIEDLIRIASESKISAVQIAALMQLGTSGDFRTVPALVEILAEQAANETTDPLVILATLYALGESDMDFLSLLTDHRESLMQSLKKLSTRHHDDIQALTSKMLVAIGGDRALPNLIAGLREPEAVGDWKNDAVALDRRHKLRNEWNAAMALSTTSPRLVADQIRVSRESSTVLRESYFPALFQTDKDAAGFVLELNGLPRQPKKMAALPADLEAQYQKLIQGFDLESEFEATATTHELARAALFASEIPRLAALENLAAKPLAEQVEYLPAFFDRLKRESGEGLYRVAILRYLARLDLEALFQISRREDPLIEDLKKLCMDNVPEVAAFAAFKLSQFRTLEETAYFVAQLQGLAPTENTVGNPVELAEREQAYRRVVGVLRPALPVAVSQLRRRIEMRQSPQAYVPALLVLDAKTALETVRAANGVAVREFRPKISVESKRLYSHMMKIKRSLASESFSARARGALAGVSDAQRINELERLAADFEIEPASAKEVALYWELLQSLVHHDNPMVRLAALNMLCQVDLEAYVVYPHDLSKDTFIQDLLRLCSDEHEAIRDFAVLKLSQFQRAEIAPALVEALEKVSVLNEVGDEAVLAQRRSQRHRLIDALKQIPDAVNLLSAKIQARPVQGASSQDEYAERVNGVYLPALYRLDPAMAQKTVVGLNAGWVSADPQIFSAKLEVEYKKLNANASVELKRVEAIGGMPVSQAQEWHAWLLALASDKGLRPSLRAAAIRSLKTTAFWSANYQPQPHNPGMEKLAAVALSPDTNYVLRAMAVELIADARTPLAAETLARFFVSEGTVKPLLDQLYADAASNTQQAVEENLLRQTLVSAFTHFSNSTASEPIAAAYLHQAAQRGRENVDLSLTAICAHFNPQLVQETGSKPGMVSSGASVVREAVENEKGWLAPENKVELARVRESLKYRAGSGEVSAATLEAKKTMADKTRADRFEALLRGTSDKRVAAAQALLILIQEKAEPEYLNVLVQVVQEFNDQVPDAVLDFAVEGLAYYPASDKLVVGLRRVLDKSGDLRRARILSALASSGHQGALEIILSQISEKQSGVVVVAAIEAARQWWQTHPSIAIFKTLLEVPDWERNRLGTFYGASVEFTAAQAALMDLVSPENSAHLTSDLKQQMASELRTKVREERIPGVSWKSEHRKAIINPLLEKIEPSARELSDWIIQGRPSFWIWTIGTAGILVLLVLRNWVWSLMTRVNGAFGDRSPTKPARTKPTLRLGSITVEDLKKGQKPSAARLAIQSVTLDLSREKTKLAKLKRIKMRIGRWINHLDSKPGVGPRQVVASSFISASILRPLMEEFWTLKFPFPTDLEKFDPAVWVAEANNAEREKKIKQMFEIVDQLSHVLAYEYQELQKQKTLDSEEQVRKQRILDFFFDYVFPMQQYFWTYQTVLDDIPNADRFFFHNLPIDGLAYNNISDLSRQALEKHLYELYLAGENVQRHTFDAAFEWTESPEEKQAQISKMVGTYLNRKREKADTIWQDGHVQSILFSVGWAVAVASFKFFTGFEFSMSLVSIVFHVAVVVMGFAPLWNKRRTVLRSKAHLAQQIELHDEVMAEIEANKQMFKEAAGLPFEVAGVDGGDYKNARFRQELDKRRHIPEDALNSDALSYLLVLPGSDAEHQQKMLKRYTEDPRLKRTRTVVLIMPDVFADGVGSAVAHLTPRRFFRGDEETFGEFLNKRAVREANPHLEQWLKDNQEALRPKLSKKMSELIGFALPAGGTPEQKGRASRRVDSLGEEQSFFSVADAIMSAKTAQDRGRSGLWMIHADSVNIGPRHISYEKGVDVQVAWASFEQVTKQRLPVVRYDDTGKIIDILMPDQMDELFEDWSESRAEGLQTDPEQDRYFENPQAKRCAVLTGFCGGEYGAAFEDFSKRVADGLLSLRAKHGEEVFDKALIHLNQKAGFTGAQFVLMPLIILSNIKKNHKKDSIYQHFSRLRTRISRADLTGSHKKIAEEVVDLFENNFMLIPENQAPDVVPIIPVPNGGINSKDSDNMDFEDLIEQNRFNLEAATTVQTQDPAEIPTAVPATQKIVSILEPVWKELGNAYRQALKAFLTWLSHHLQQWAKRLEVKPATLEADGQWIKVRMPADGSKAQLVFDKSLGVLDQAGNPADAIDLPKNGAPGTFVTNDGNMKLEIAEGVAKLTLKEGAASFKTSSGGVFQSVSWKMMAPSAARLVQYRPVSVQVTLAVQRASQIEKKLALLDRAARDPKRHVRVNLSQQVPTRVLERWREAHPYAISKGSFVRHADVALEFQASDADPKQILNLLDEAVRRVSLSSFFSYYESVLDRAKNSRAEALAALLPAVSPLNLEAIAQLTRLDDGLNGTLIPASTETQTVVITPSVIQREAVPLALQTKRLEVEAGRRVRLVLALNQDESEQKLIEQGYLKVGDVDEVVYTEKAAGQKIGVTELYRLLRAQSKSKLDPSKISFAGREEFDFSVSAADRFETILHHQLSVVEIQGQTQTAWVLFTILNQARRGEKRSLKPGAIDWTALEQALSNAGWLRRSA